MPPSPRPKPVTWRELLDSYDKATTEIGLILIEEGRLSRTARARLQRLMDREMLPMLRRAGRRMPSGK